MLLLVAAIDSFRHHFMLELFIFFVLLLSLILIQCVFNEEKKLNGIQNEEQNKTTRMCETICLVERKKNHQKFFLFCFHHNKFKRCYHHMRLSSSENVHFGHLFYSELEIFEILVYILFNSVRILYLHSKSNYCVRVYVCAFSHPSSNNSQ